METAYSSATHHTELWQHAGAYANVSLEALCLSISVVTCVVGWLLLKENAKRIKAQVELHEQSIVPHEACASPIQPCKEHELHQVVRLQDTNDEIEGESFWNFDGDDSNLANTKACDDTTHEERSSLWSMAIRVSQDWDNTDLSSHQSPGEDAKDPASAATADASRALEAAIASGCPQLVDSALASASRLCSSSWLARACSHLRAAGIPLSLERAVEIVLIFGQERRGDLAVDLYYEQIASCLLDLSQLMTDGDKKVPAEDLYSAALEACARCGDFESAARAARMVHWRSPSSISGQAALLALARWLARLLCVEEALKCYRSVWRTRGSPDLPTHRAVLIASVRCTDMTLASNLFQELSDNGLMPDSDCFSAMICGYCAEGNLQQAVQYFYKMMQSDIAPTTSIFNAILDGCAWRNMPALMEQVLADMESASVKPSSATVSILLKGYGQSYGVNQALAIFDDMPKRYGLELDGQAYGTLISLCLRNDCFHTALNVYERMSLSGCRACARTYEAFISSCCSHGELEHAVRLVDDALGLSVEHDQHQPVTPLHLKQEVLEQLFQLILRRKQAHRLGAPLLTRLQKAGVQISEHLSEALVRYAQPDTRVHQCVLHQRRAEFQCWRKFVHAA